MEAISLFIKARCGKLSNDHFGTSLKQTSFSPRLHSFPTVSVTKFSREPIAFLICRHLNTLVLLAFLEEDFTAEGLFLIEDFCRELKCQCIYVFFFFFVFPAGKDLQGLSSEQTSEEAELKRDKIGFDLRQLN